MFEKKKKVVGIVGKKTLTPVRAGFHYNDGFVKIGLSAADAFNTQPFKCRICASTLQLSFIYSKRPLISF